MVNLFGVLFAKFGYKQALRDHSLKTIHGDDASAQPGKLQEVMLHETGEFKRGSVRGLVGDQEGIRGVFRGSGPLGAEIASAIPKVSEGIK